MQAHIGKSSAWNIVNWFTYNDLNKKNSTMRGSRLYSVFPKHSSEVQTLNNEISTWAKESSQLLPPCHCDCIPSASNSFKRSVNSAWQAKLQQWIRQDAWKRHFIGKVASKSNKFATGQNTLWNKLSPAHGDVLHSFGKEQRCGLERMRHENQSRAARLQQ